MGRKLVYKRGGGSVQLPRQASLPIGVLEQATHSVNRVFEALHEVSPHVSGLLGMRNLSAFVGAAFASELQDASDGLLLLNPHQDGYPDLLLMDSVGREALEMALPGAKEPFSPFPPGGLEIKATCGDVETPAQLARRGLTKPAIGDQRVHLIKGLSWKAHHRETNNLLALVWDFVEQIPAIAAVLYSSGLLEDDWGRIVQPRPGGGRTTSVSIMGRSGIGKLCSNTLLVLDGPYDGLLNRYR